MRRIAALILLTGAALAALFCSGRLVLNTTYSVPVGLWWRVDEPLQCGDTVRVPIAAFKSTGWMPEWYWRKNGWGESRDFLKHVAGLSGDLVETDSSGLLRVAGKVIANSAPLSFDKAGWFYTNKVDINKEVVFVLWSNPVVISVTVMIVLCLFNLNIVLALLIAAMTAGFAAGMSIPATMGTLISGMGGNSETALALMRIGLSWVWARRKRR